MELFSALIAGVVCYLMSVAYWAARGNPCVVEVVGLATSISLDSTRKDNVTLYTVSKNNIFGIVVIIIISK